MTELEVLLSNEQKSFSSKEPWLAVVLSQLLTGAGQIYAGKKTRGIILIILELAFWLTAAWLIIGLNESLPAVVILIVIWIAIRIWSLFDAHKLVRINNYRCFENLRKGDKDPWLAVFLSAYLPGFGHLYLGFAE